MDSASRRALLIASTDLSHYFDAATAATLDGDVCDSIAAFSPERLLDVFERYPEGERGRHVGCGIGPAIAVMMAARALGARQARVLRYAHSGEVSGDYDGVVGYLAAVLGTFDVETGMLSDVQRRQLVDVARRSVAARVSGSRLTTGGALRFATGVGRVRHAEARRRAARLSRHARLPAKTLPRRSHAARPTPRARIPAFPPVTVHELVALTLEVSVLGPLERIDPHATGRRGRVDDDWLARARRRAGPAAGACSSRRWRPSAAGTPNSSCARPASRPALPPRPGSAARSFSASPPRSSGTGSVRSNVHFVITNAYLRVRSRGALVACAITASGYRPLLASLVADFRAQAGCTPIERSTSARLRGFWPHSSCVRFWLRGRQFQPGGSYSAAAASARGGTNGHGGIAPGLGADWGGLGITITGTGFTAGATVSIGGTPATGTSRSPARRPSRRRRPPMPPARRTSW